MKNEAKKEDLERAKELLADQYNEVEISNVFSRLTPDKVKDSLDNLDAYMAGKGEEDKKAARTVWRELVKELETG